MIILAVTLGYLLGSIPFGLVFTKLAGKGDIRNYGSGNIGATNVMRHCGKLCALLTLICDCGKGALAVYLATKLINPQIGLYAGVAAILGHVFPVWLKFRGGKAVATALAVFGIICWKLGAAMVLSWLIIFFIFRISSLAAIVAFILAPLYAYLLDLNQSVLFSAIFISILVLIRHLDNIKRLLAGRER